MNLSLIICVCSDVVISAATPSDGTDVSIPCVVAGIALKTAGSEIFSEPDGPWDEDDGSQGCDKDCGPQV